MPNALPTEKTKSMTEYDSIAENIRGDDFTSEQIIALANLYGRAKFTDSALGYLVLASALSPHDHLTTFKIGHLLLREKSYTVSLFCFLKTRNNNFKKEESHRLIKEIESKIKEELPNNKIYYKEWNPERYIKLYGFNEKHNKYPIVFSLSSGAESEGSYAESINNTFNKHYKSRFISFNLSALRNELEISVDKFIYSASIDMNPTVFFYYNQSISKVENTIRLETISWIKKLTKSALVLMSLDLAKPYFENSIRLLSGVADLLVTTDQTASKDIRELMRGRVYQGWHLVDQQTYCDQGEARDIDVSFVGSVVGAYTYRKPIIDYLQKNDVPLFLAGSGLGKRLSNDEYAAVMRRSRIIINFSSFTLLSGWDYHHVTRVFHPYDRPMHHLKARVFEAIEAGALLFESENDITPDWFRPYEHYIPFSTKEDLLEKLRYYLDHESERERIAAAARDYAQEHYRPETFWRSIFEKLEQTGQFPHLPKPRDLDHDDMKENHA